MVPPLFTDRDVQMFKTVLLLGALAVPVTAIAASVSAKDLEGIKSAMDDRLKDTESAKLKDVRIAKDGTICGLVNAKNSYGAYVGYEPFIALKLSTGKFYVAGIGRESGQVCASKGI